MTNPGMDTLRESRPTAPEKLAIDDLEPRPIAPGETEMIVVRHGAYEREPNSRQVGSLTPDGAQEIFGAATLYFGTLVAELPAGEEDSLYVLTVASDTQYRGGGPRAYETAELAQQAAERAFTDSGLSAEEHVLNSTHHSQQLVGHASGPLNIRSLREPQIFGTEFEEELRRRRGADFFSAYERDWEEALRKEHGAEGTDELAERLRFSIDLLADLAARFHSTHPGARLVIYVATHYDTISPLAKQITGVDRDTYLGVDYGAGFSVRIGADGHQGAVRISGQNYPFVINSPDR